MSKPTNKIVPMMPIFKKSEIAMPPPNVNVPNQKRKYNDSNGLQNQQQLYQESQKKMQQFYPNGTAQPTKPKSQNRFPVVLFLILSSETKIHTATFTYTKHSKPICPRSCWIRRAKPK